MLCPSNKVRSTPFTRALTLSFFVAVESFAEKGHKIERAIVLESTWAGVGRILDHPSIKDLPRIKIQSEKTFFWRSQPHGVEFLATIEAIYYGCKEFYLAVKDKEAYKSAITRGEEEGTEKEREQEKDAEAGKEKEAETKEGDGYDGRYDMLLYYFCMAHQRIAAFYEQRPDLIKPPNWILHEEALRNENNKEA